MYHYVRDLPRSRFPEIKGMQTAAFRDQVSALSRRFEMATLESALEFVSGQYRPRRDLCLLTFDDGLKDHLTAVAPILGRAQIQGVFFLSTTCLENHRVLSVHKNHFLMASLGFAEFRRVFMKELETSGGGVPEEIDSDVARNTYRWDTEEVAAFKYLLNFRIAAERRERVLGSLFADHFGDEAEFARDLYMSWPDAREMQAAGMVLGGHGHIHAALALLGEEAQRSELETCAGLLRLRLDPQPLWPFSYPYGKRDSWNRVTRDALRRLRFDCAFSTEVGSNGVGEDSFALRRIDPKDVAVSRRRSGNRPGSHSPGAY